MLKPSKEVEYKKLVSQEPMLLVCDLGGTNCNFGVFTGRDTPELIRSVHYKSQQIEDFPSFVASVLEYIKKTYGFALSQICFAVAGVIQGSNVKPTNLPFIVDADAIKGATGLKTVLLANDFQVIGYGLHLIDPQAIVCVLPGSTLPQGVKGIIGAGTGLGKSIIVDAGAGQYKTLSSEGGHADFPAYSELELELVRFIQTLKENTFPVSWEDLLSGNGIGRMYTFFKNKNANNSDPINIKSSLQELQPDEIFNARHRDLYCWDTYQLYARIYARCAKNFALETLAYGGIYIAGGIAAKNLDLFKEKEFETSWYYNGKHADVLRRIPVYVITDYNISLYGAAQYLHIHGQGISSENHRI